MFLVYLSLLQLILVFLQDNRRLSYLGKIYYVSPIGGSEFSSKKQLILHSFLFLIFAIIINLIPFIIMKTRKQKSRLLLFFVVPGFSELYTLISILHLNKIIANGIYDMSNPVWNKSFYFN